MRGKRERARERVSESGGGASEQASERQTDRQRQRDRKRERERGRERVCVSVRVQRESVCVRAGRHAGGKRILGKRILKFYTLHHKLLNP